MYAHGWACLCHLCMVSVEARRGFWILRNWSCNLGTKLRSSSSATALSAESSLLPPKSCFLYWPHLVRLALWPSWSPVRFWPQACEAASPAPEPVEFSPFVLLKAGWTVCSARWFCCLVGGWAARFVLASLGIHTSLYTHKVLCASVKCLEVLPETGNKKAVVSHASG